MRTHAPKKGSKGFTLIELLIVIGVLGILAGIILVAVDPAKRLKQARDARRNSEVNAILNAILNYTVDNKGVLPGELQNATTTPTTSYILGTATNTETCGSSSIGTACGEAPGTVHHSCLDIGENILVDTYIAEIPVDPAGFDADENATSTTVTYDATRTGYYVQKSNAGRIEVGSCNPEEESQIKVKR